ncbi:hypothetical protein FXO38_04966 [Capsicum annuum]|nr:hypothetical protein FXO38_04966 [Capsicum annuum]KAF3677498.1 hypothetical protein FXO37_04787 [Capsicum annuum]
MDAEWLFSVRCAAEEVFDQIDEDLAASIQKGSLDWERALRCLKHALRNTPSPDWWRRVLLVAPCHRLHAQAPTLGAVFTSEMVCEAVIERIVELLKLTNSGNILRLRTLLEIVLRVETTRKILSFHKEEKSSDPNNPQSILLDFISSCQNLRIWTLNTATREYLNNEQLQKGKQIDEWWRQVNKGIILYVEWGDVTEILMYLNGPSAGGGKEDFAQGKELCKVDEPRSCLNDVDKEHLVVHEPIPQKGDPKRVPRKYRLEDLTEFLPKDSKLGKSDEESNSREEDEQTLMG